MSSSRLFLWQLENARVRSWMTLTVAAGIADLARRGTELTGSAGLRALLA
jgi:hypothetical protein